MAEEETKTVYVVAPGVTMYDDDNVFPEGTEITPEDLGDLSAFRALLAAGKIISTDGGDEPLPPPEGEWNYTSIDSELSATSPNPVENRALYAKFQELGKTDAAMAKQISALTEAMAVPIPAEDIKTIYKGAMNNGEEVS